MIWDLVQLGLSLAMLVSAAVFFKRGGVRGALTVAVISIMSLIAHGHPQGTTERISAVCSLFSTVLWTVIAMFRMDDR